MPIVQAATLLPLRSRGLISALVCV